MRKSVRMLGAAAIMGLTAIAVQAEVNMVVNQAEGGTTREVTITTASTVTFTASGFTVTGADSQVVDFAYGNVLNITFASGPSAIGNIAEEAKATFRLAQNPVGETLSVITPADFESGRLTITSLNGSTALSESAWDGTTLNVSALAPGVYLLTIDKTTIKFIKK